MPRSRSMRPLGSGWRERLGRLAEALAREGGWELPPASETERRLDSLSRYLDQVVTWNASLDLTAARSEDELVDLFVADALVLDRALDAESSESWVDVGSGAGAPGLVLGVLRPELALTLVEPRAKRVAFLRTAVGRLGLRRVAVEHARSDALPDAGHDVALSRATFPPAQWAEEGARLARHRVWVLLARAETPTAPGLSTERSLRYHWPLTGVERRAACLAKKSG